MSRTSACIQMLELLGTGKIYKISELAEKLRTSPRNIIEYRKELQESGYDILTIPGKYGGYKLMTNNLLPKLRFNYEEIKAINEAYKFLLSKDSFMCKNSFESAMSKIMGCYDNSEEEIIPISIFEKEESIYDSSLLGDFYDQLKIAIDKRLICVIDVITNSNKIQTKTIKPYELYIYNENWFVLTECVETEGFRHYKLSRIKKLNVLNKHFSRDPYFKKSEHFDAEGYKKNDEWFEVKLEVNGYHLLKLTEKTIGKNQQIEMIDNKKGIITVSMQYKFNIISFVMGLGSFCKVIEPKWLKDQILKITTEMQNLYKNE